MICFVVVGVLNLLNCSSRVVVVVLLYNICCVVVVVVVVVVLTTRCIYHKPHTTSCPSRRYRR